MKPALKRRNPQKADAAGSDANDYVEPIPVGSISAGSSGADPEVSLDQAAAVLFGPERDTILLRDGRSILVMHAKVRHVGLLLRFFNSIVARMTKADLVALVEAIGDAQRPTESGASRTLDEKLQSILDKLAMLFGLAEHAVEGLPALVAALSPLTEEQYGDLELDEGIKVVGAIFVVNHAFFSQNLPHATKGFLAQVAKKVQAK